MSWYEEATKAIVALINAAIEERGDMPEPKEITAIIAKHDPNRWVPVTERLPERHMYVQFFHGDHICQGQLWEGEHCASDNDGCFEGSPASHWRPIVLPEVKG